MAPGDVLWGLASINAISAAPDVHFAGLPATPSGRVAPDPETPPDPAPALAYSPRGSHARGCEASRIADSTGDGAMSAPPASGAGCRFLVKVAESALPRGRGGADSTVKRRGNRLFGRLGSGRIVLPPDTLCDSEGSRFGPVLEGA